MKTENIYFNIKLDTYDTEDESITVESAYFSFLLYFNQKKNLEKILIKLNFDYDIFMFSTCVMDKNTYNSIRNEKQIELSFMEFVNEIIQCLIYPDKNRGMYRLFFEHDRGGGFLHIIERSNYKELELFMLRFDFEEPQNCHIYAQMRFSEVKRDIDRYQRGIDTILSLLNEYNPVLLEDIIRKRI